MPDTQRLTIQQAAAQLNVSTRTIRRWIATGQIRAERVGPRLIRIPADTLAGIGRPIGGAA